MSKAHAHAILAAADIKPHLVDGWVMSDPTPEFFERASDIFGLYLDPPENELVVSIDVKTSFQAKGLTPPYSTSTASARDPSDAASLPPEFAPE